MTNESEQAVSRPVLHLVVCAAPPALQIGELVQLLMDDGWTVCIIATPTAATWIDTEALAEQTGHPVRWEWRRPGEPKPLPKADAVVVAPATFNTINKWALGINDNLALGTLNEALGLKLPVLVSPYAKSTLTTHPAFLDSAQRLNLAGVSFTHSVTTEPITTGSDLFQAVCERIRSHL